MSESPRPQKPEVPGAETTPGHREDAAAKSGTPPAPSESSGGRAEPSARLSEAFPATRVHGIDVDSSPRSPGAERHSSSDTRVTEVRPLIDPNEDAVPKRAGQAVDSDYSTDPTVFTAPKSSETVTGVAKVVPSSRSPFGGNEAAIEAIKAIWDKPPKGERRAGSPVKAKKSRRSPLRKPLWALPGMVVLACLMAFLAWVAAPAVLLSLGFGQVEEITIQQCSPGFAPQCEGIPTYQTDEDNVVSYRIIGDVTVVDEGSTYFARVISGTAYVGDTAGLLLRALLPLCLYALTTLVFIFVSGAGRLYTGKRAARLSCFAFAAVLWVGFIAVIAVADMLAR